MEKFYALFDLQLGGFKAGLASKVFDEVVAMGAERAYSLSQGDSEPCDDNLTDKEILDLYDYEVQEVSEQDYETILNSEEIGLLTIVTLD